MTDALRLADWPDAIARVACCKHVPRYVAEFQFRYNNRLNEDIFGEAIRGA